MTITDGALMALYMSAMAAVGAAFEALGVLAIMLGTVLAAARVATSLRTQPQSSAYRLFRQEVGGAILLGLEFLVAGDIIRSIVVAPSLENVIVLSLIVLTRIVLSIALQVELEGRWPWRRHEADCRSSTGDREAAQTYADMAKEHRLFAKQAAEPGAK